MTRVVTLRSVKFYEIKSNANVCIALCNFKTPLAFHARSQTESVTCAAPLPVTLPFLKLARLRVCSLRPSSLYLDHSHCLVLAPATLAALPSTRAIPDRDVFYVAHPIRSILPSSFCLLPFRGAR